MKIFYIERIIWPFILIIYFKPHTHDVPSGDAENKLRPGLPVQKDLLTVFTKTI